MPGRALRGRWARWLRWPLRVAALLATLLAGPLAVLAFGELDLQTHWSAASHAGAGLAPAAPDEPQAVVRVFGARTYRWRGAFAIHTWIATKRAGERSYTIRHVIGWNLYRGRSAVTVSQREVSDFHWFSARPQLLAERRGEGVEALIDRIDAAVRDYPYADRYSAWPGPNSNTFTAFVARAVPELGLDLPPTAIGKDFLGDGAGVAPTPSGTGWQASVRGMLGVSIARAEGVEFNLLGLSFGLDFDDFALRLPGFGRVSLAGGLPAPQQEPSEQGRQQHQ